MSNVPQDVIDELEKISQDIASVGINGFGNRITDVVSNLRAQRSNAEPVAYVLMNEHGDMVMWSQDRSVSEYDQKAFWPKTKIVDLYSAPPDYAAGVAAGMMKAAEMVFLKSSEAVTYEEKNHLEQVGEQIYAAIPADSKAALREMCMKVAIQVYVSRNIISRKNDDADLKAIVDAKIGGRDHV